MLLPPSSELPGAKAPTSGQKSAALGSVSPWDNSGHLNLADPSRQVDGAIQRASWVGNSQGGQSAMVAGISYPDRVRKFVMGGIAYRHRRRPLFDGQSPSEGSRATRQALDDPSRHNIRRYLRVHIDDESPVTDELVDYIHHGRYDRMVPFEVSI